MIETLKRRRVTALALAVTALAVSILFGALGGGASASETPPVNTKKPTVSPSKSYIGDTLTGTQGTWTGEPTGYSYEWQRCGAKCEAISGQTGTTYTATPSDAGKTLVFVVTATNSAGSTKAEGSSKVENRLSWYSCGKWGGEGYEDSACTKKGGSNPYSWLRPTAATPFTSTNILKSGAGSVHILKWTPAGLTVEIQCAKVQGSGSLVNHETNAAVEGYKPTYSQCTVPRPAGAGCRIDNGETLQFNSLSATSPESPAALNPEVKVVASSGNTMLTFSLYNCQGSVSFLNHEWSLEGYYMAQVNSGGALTANYTKIREAESLLFNKSIVVGLAGEDVLTAEGGLPVKLATTP